MEGSVQEADGLGFAANFSRADYQGFCREFEEQRISFVNEDSASWSEYPECSLYNRTCSKKFVIYIYSIYVHSIMFL